MDVTALTLLQRALVELDTIDYYPQCKDRVLAVFDAARITLSPPAGRTPAQHDHILKVCQEAQREVAKTVAPGDDDMSEIKTYLRLTSLGQIQKEKHRTLLNMTIARLRKETPEPIPA